MTAEILRNEGGFVDNPSDAGRATNFGITEGFLASHRADFGNAQSVRDITQQQAAASYVKYFFDAAHFNLLPNVANLQMQLYDMAVNMGVRYSDGETEATKVLQHALGIAVDGELGQGTIHALMAAIAAHGAQAINNAVVNARIHFYNVIAQEHPEDQVFLAGWTNRANKYRV
ncbi:MAG: glycosyl hydrolase 108 family protein [Terriglobia bacterium]|nr:glycosyl hydrolase 108 family protein [Terriglobia bacterium]